MGLSAYFARELRKAQGGKFLGTAYAYQNVGRPVSAFVDDNVHSNGYWKFMGGFDGTNAYDRENYGGTIYQPPGVEFPSEWRDSPNPGIVITEPCYVQIELVDVSVVLGAAPFGGLFSIGVALADFDDEVADPRVDVASVIQAFTGHNDGDNAWAFAQPGATRVALQTMDFVPGHGWPDRWLIAPAFNYQPAFTDDGVFSDPWEDRLDQATRPSVFLKVSMWSLPDGYMDAGFAPAP